MTNNLKAERTLTAEELQAIIDGCEKATPGPWFKGDKWVFVYPRSEEPTHALENIFRDVPEAQENCLHVARLDPDTVKAMASMALQSLSTQQPMGEVRVKPLEWIERKYGRLDGESIIGHYRVYDAYSVDTASGLKFLPPSWKGPFDSSPKEAGSLDDCKAEAQEDYRKRILSALHPNQESGE